MPKKRGRSVEGRRKAAKRSGSPARRAVRASVVKRSVPSGKRVQAEITVQVPDATQEVELWMPPKRPKKPVPGKRWSSRHLFLKDEPNEPTSGSGVTTTYTNHPEVPTDDLFIAPSQSKLTNRELGFDQKGRCLYGCDGVRSIKKGYTNIAMHHYRCPFWETVDGKTKTPF